MKCCQSPHVVTWSLMSRHGASFHDMEPHVTTWSPLGMKAYTLPCRNMDLYHVVTSNHLKTKDEGHLLPCRNMGLYVVVTSSQKNIKNKEQELPCRDMNSLHVSTS